MTDLPKALAALLDNDVLNKLMYTPNQLYTNDTAEYKALAFECHKALTRLYEMSQCEEGDTYLYGEMQQFGYNSDQFVALVAGYGDTDEEAIFNAVRGWYNKQQTKENNK
jgi:hypothetical protein